MIFIYIYIYWLVVLTILKNISQWEGLSHIFVENKTCSKPPTSIYIYRERERLYVINILICMYVYKMYYILCIVDRVHKAPYN